MFNASQRLSELERNVEELKRKAAQNSGEAEYIEKVVYTVKQSAEDVKKVSKSLELHSYVDKGATSLLQVTCFERAVFRDTDRKEWEWI